MTLLRRGIKRLSTLFCVVLLLLHLGAYPLRARATAGALAAVAGVTVLGAYLMASGVYPYISEAGQSLSEWTSDNLQPLVDKYNSYLISIGKSYQIVLNGATPTIKGYMTQGAIMIANDVWGKLREFVQWIQSEYALTDNQTGVELGATATGLPPELPISSSWTYDNLRMSGFSFPDGSSNYFYMGATASECYPAAYLEGKDYFRVTAFIFPPVQDKAVRYTYDGHNTVEEANFSYSLRQVNDTSYPILAYTMGSGFYSPYRRLGEWDGLLFDSKSDFENWVIDYALSGGQGAFSGVVADTTTVAPLDALPADTPWGGLAVEGVGAAASPMIVSDTIGGAITDREKPVVTPVTIDIEAGTDVDTESGEITGDGTVTITPADIPLVSTDYQILGLSGVFPFSLPWDIYRIYSALNAEPVRPEWDVTVYIPVLDIQAPMHIGFPEDVAPAVDNFMSLARKLILIFLCVLTLVGVRNLIR